MTDKKTRPQKLSGSTYQVKTGCGTLYITINENDGIIFEVFATMGKAGGCAASQIETIGRLISLGIRTGVSPEAIIKQTIGISCHSPVPTSDGMIMSCADAIGKTLRLHLSKE